MNSRSMSSDRNVWLKSRAASGAIFLRVTLSILYCTTAFFLYNKHNTRYFDKKILQYLKEEISFNERTNVHPGNAKSRTRKQTREDISLDDAN